MSARWLRFGAVLPLSLAVASMASSCFTFPEQSSTGGAGVGTPCNIDGDCDDGEACTKDTCGADKVCKHAALADGPAPDVAQKAGDCKTVVCDGGKAKDTPEDGDVLDDGNDCTADSCNAGNVVRTAKPDGTLCTSMGNAGRCDALGVCKVACATAADCVSTNPCVTAECDTTQGVCNFPPVPDGTETQAASEPNGDCQIHICLGGVEMSVANDADTPKSATDCDDEVCTNGVPSNPALLKHNTCSTHNGNQPGFCDGSGTCQECAEDTDCPGPTDDCKHPACDQTTFKCFEAHTPAMTPTTGNPPQIAGDCQTTVCDGNGGTMAVYGQTDPQDDGNQCTTDTCAAPNTTTHPSVPNGTACGTALACVSGICNGCTMNSQCKPASCAGTVLTKAQTCNTTTNACVAPSPPTQDCAPYLCSSAGNGSCTTTCTSDTGCSQGGVGNWCSANMCVPKLAQGVACGGNNQCQSGFCVDGVCCNTACNGTCQACTAALKGSGQNGQCGAIANGTDPSNECPDDGPTSCDRDGFCNGAGACRLYAASTVCGNASCTGGTLTKQKTCDGGGNCVTPNPATQSCSPYLCSGAACATTCTTDSNCAAGYWCSGNMCVAKSLQGALCLGANQCASGFCVDNRCCDTPCNTACMACSAARKESGTGNGACGFAEIGVNDPRNLCGTSPPCGNTGTCAANGVCTKAASGTPCGMQSCSGNSFSSNQCDGTGSCGALTVSGPCPNNLVCQDAMTCWATCGTNNASGDARCLAGYYCNGASCQPDKPSGQPCTRNGECQSGNCTGSNTCG